MRIAMRDLKQDCGPDSIYDSELSIELGRRRSGVKTIVLCDEHTGFCLELVLDEFDAAVKFLKQHDPSGDLAVEQDV